MSSSRSIACSLIAFVGSSGGCRAIERSCAPVARVVCEPNPGKSSLEARFVFRVIPVPSGSLDGPHLDGDGNVVQWIRPTVRERAPLWLRLGTSFGRVRPDEVWVTQDFDSAQVPPPGGWGAPAADRPKSWRDLVEPTIDLNPFEPAETLTLTIVVRGEHGFFGPRTVRVPFDATSIVIEGPEATAPLVLRSGR